MGDVISFPDPIPDDRLRLLFTCCHPALAQEAQIALSLRIICGVSVARIARAFLVGEPAMYQRGFVSFGNEVLVMRQPEWVGQVGFEPAVDRWNLFADSEPAYGGSILFPNTSPAGYRMAYDGTSIYSFGQCELRRFGPFTADECEIPLQEAPCNADIDDNGLVNVDDLLAIIQDWGMVGEDGTRPAGDCAPLPLGDCMVNVDDLLSVIASWGSTCDEPGT